MIWLVDIAIGFCDATNEIGSWIIHEYKWIDPGGYVKGRP
jgi:hypothetical protein